MAAEMKGLASVTLGKQTALMLAAVAVQRFGSTATTLTYILLCVWAMKGARSSLQALSLGWLVWMLNPGLFPAVGGGGALKWSVLAVASFSVSARWLGKRPHLPRPVVALSAFLIVCAIGALAKSPFLAVSVIESPFIWSRRGGHSACL